MLLTCATRRRCTTHDVAPVVLYGVAWPGAVHFRPGRRPRRESRYDLQSKGHLAEPRPAPPRVEDDPSIRRSSTCKNEGRAVRACVHRSTNSAKKCIIRTTLYIKNIIYFIFLNRAYHTIYFVFMSNTMLDCERSVSRTLFMDENSDRSH